MAANRWGVGRDTALIIAFAMAPRLGLRGEIESEEGLLEFPCSPLNFLETNKTNICAAHYKHRRIQSTGIDLLYPRRSFSCCCMSVLLVIAS